MYRRRTARVLVVDAVDRVLLLRYEVRASRTEPDHDVWMTPGGGVHRWESLRKAAARELREEVGLVVAPAALGTPVAYGEGSADLGWAKGRFRDDYFVHRVDTHTVDIAEMEARELTSYAGHRWWRAGELRTTTDSVVPWGLADLLDAVAAGRSERPVRLPWHL
jgi:8-oxo-dGTP pyrophosphatase MutT (NUDIX family)